jgi:glycosyltransferase 2 family protein
MEVRARRILGFTGRMVSRERLLRVGSTVAAAAGARRVRIAGQLLLLIGLVFVLLRLRTVWHDSHVTLDRINWPSLVGGGLVAAVAVAGAAFIWLEILRRLGETPQPRWAGIYLQAQLGKYIPGSLWQYAGRAVGARTQAISVRTTAVSTAVELAAAVLAAAVLASLTGSVWLQAVAALSVAGALLLCLRMTAADRTLTSAVRATAIAAVLYMLIWAALGVALWLTARALLELPVSEIGFYTGAFSIAWLAGLFAFFAPAGIGVREAALVGLLHTRIGTADAVLVAAVSRGMLTIVDIVAAAVGTVLLRKPRCPKSGEALHRRNERAPSEAKR